MAWRWRQLAWTTGVFLLLIPILWIVFVKAGDPDPPPSEARRPVTHSDPAMVLHTVPLTPQERRDGEIVLRRIRRKLRSDHDEVERNRVKEEMIRCARLTLPERTAGIMVIRLFALSYPSLAEAWAQKVIEDPLNGTPWEKREALLALGVLAESKWGEAESILLRLCQDSDKDRRDVWTLARADPTGAHRALYQRLAGAGDFESIWALSRCPDPKSIEILRKGAAHKREVLDQETIQAGFFQESLLLAESLNSGAWIGLAQNAILDEAVPTWSFRTSWALEVGRVRREVWFESALRKRLSSIYRSGRVRSLPEGLVVRDDGSYDDVLLALARIGSHLTVEEWGYLHSHGYACEPRSRLAEMMGSNGYPPENP